MYLKVHYFGSAVPFNLQSNQQLIINLISKHGGGGGVYLYIWCNIFLQNTAKWKHKVKKYEYTQSMSTLKLCLRQLHE